MNKLIFTNFLLIIAFSQSFSQKVDMDNFKFTVDVLHFPIHYVPLEERTFMVEYKGVPEYAGIADKISIAGFKKVENKATVRVQLNPGAFSEGPATPSSRVEQTKDKAGKVTSSRNLYKVSYTNRGGGLVRIFGPENKMQVKSKKKKKDDVKEEEKEAETPNKFLADMPADEVDNSQNAKMTKWASLDKEYGNATSEQTTPKAANDEYNLNHYKNYVAQKADYQNHVSTMVNHNAKVAYGYNPYKDAVRLSVLDTEKHPEYSDYQNAVKAAKVILEKMKAHESIEPIREKIQPVCNYFLEVVSKYSKDDKGERRLKHFTYWNLGQIYLLTDQLDLAKSVAKEMLKLDFDKGDAEDIMEDAEIIEAQLAFHHMTTRHLIPATEDVVEE